MATRKNANGALTYRRTACTVLVTCGDRKPITVYSHDTAWRLANALFQETGMPVTIKVIEPVHGLPDP